MRIFRHLFLLLFLYDVSAQRADKWYFGINAGLTFTTMPPAGINGGQTSIPDNTSTISDLNGNLLFYTDGNTVWNKNHQVMPNGGGLAGNYTAGQGVLIVPIPCDANRYVIFTNTEFASPGNLKYSVVNMTLSSGLGDVVQTQKNVSLGSGWCEKICAYYSSANNNYWVLVHRWNSDEFVAFNVNASSIAATSVTSAIGSVHSCGSYSGAHDASGQLTISRDGKRVVNVLSCQDKYELFDMDQATGILSNSIVLPGNGSVGWGSAFSPDGSKLYVSTIFGNTVYQYDLSNYNSSSIINSKIGVATVSTSGYNFGYMELGPDNKLYVTRPNTNSLSVVHSPNLYGSASLFSINGQSLGSNMSSHGLSRIAYNIPSNLSGASVSITASPSVICAGQSVTLSVGGANSYSWSTGSTTSSIVVTASVSTVYSVLAMYGGDCSATNSRSIQVQICNGLVEETLSQLQIYPDPVNDILNLKWPKSEEGAERVIKIFSCDGHLAILRKVTQQESATFYVGELAPGLYLIQMNNNKPQRFVKL